MLSNNSRGYTNIGVAFDAATNYYHRNDLDRVLTEDLERPMQEKSLQEFPEVVQCGLD